MSRYLRGLRKARPATYSHGLIFPSAWGGVSDDPEWNAPYEPEPEVEPGVRGEPADFDPDRKEAA